MLPMKKLAMPAVWDFTEENELWNLIKKVPERLLYIEAEGFGAGLKAGDVIVHKYDERIVQSIINFIEYTDETKFRLTMI